MDMVQSEFQRVDQDPRTIVHLDLTLNYKYILVVHWMKKDQGFFRIHPDNRHNIV
jgi:hypothetical protein